MFADRSTLLSVTISACLLSLAPAAHAGDPAAKAPADALAYLGWSDLPNDGQSVLGLIDTVLNSPRVQQEMGHEGAHVRQLYAALRTLLKHPGAVVLLPVPQGQMPVAGLALIVEAGPDAAPVAASLAQVAAMLHGPGFVAPAQIGDASLMRITPPGGPPIHFGAFKEHFVLGVGETTTKRLLDMVTAGAASLADSPGFKLACSKFEYAGKGYGVTCFAQVKPLLQWLVTLEPLPPQEAAMQEKILEAIGVNAMRNLYLRFDASDYGPRMVSWVQVEGGAGGIVSLYRQKPLADDDLRILPRDATLASCWNLDLTRLWHEGLKAADSVSPEPRLVLESAMQQASQMLLFHPVNDLFANLGDTWAIYDSPSNGGILITGLVLCGETRDAAALQGMITKIVQFITPLAAANEMTLQLRQIRQGEHEVNYLLLGGFPVPVAPAWGFAGERFAAGLHPQTVVTALSQLDPRTRGESLVEHADVRTARSKLPKDITHFVYADTRATYRYWYALKELAFTAVASLSAGTSAPFDLGSVPPFPQEYKDVRNFVAAYSCDSEGLRYEAYGAHPAAMILTSNGGLAGTALMTSIMLPSLARARDQAKRQVSAANLRGIGTACMIYANDHQDQLPPSFDTLLELDMVTEQILHSPRDPSGGRSYVYVDGQTADSDARNVLAYEKLLDDEGTYVLFCDTHVEWLPADGFRKAVVDTYKRLNRLDRLPAEFRDATKPP